LNFYKYLLPHLFENVLSLDVEFVDIESDKSNSILHKFGKNRFLMIQNDNMNDNSEETIHVTVILCIM